ncbi:MAG: hypothetical protein U1F10_01760 [Burkholderiales bacterium]
MYIYADLLNGIAVGYRLFVVALLLVALLKPKTWRGKAAWSSVVLLIFVGPFAFWGVADRLERREGHAKYEEALALFKERCKTAGEKINKVIPDVEGIFLAKIRPKGTNYGQQYELSDPYGRDLGGDAYIGSFLRGNTDVRKEPPYRYGYAFVEAIDPLDGIRYRYFGVWRVISRKDPNARNIKIELSKDPNYDLNNYGFKVIREPATGPRPRYGVTYEDISSGADRDHWIAGGSLRVLDLETGEVLAQRIGYMMDEGQGSTGAGRSPWLYATENACPDFFDRFSVVVVRGPASSVQSYQTYDFVEKVLLPRLE